jgi:hypothetical protein
MLKMLGDSYSKAVDTTSMSSGITSLLRHRLNNLIARTWLQVGAYALFIRPLWTSASTAGNGYLTSVSQYLYSLSTVPIMITTYINKLIIVRS